MWAGKRIVDLVEEKTQEPPKSFTWLNTEGFQVKSVAVGGSVSFAVTEDGLAYAWGMESNLQHEDDQCDKKQLEG